MGIEEKLKEEESFKLKRSIPLTVIDLYEEYERDYIDELQQCAEDIGVFKWVEEKVPEIKVWPLINDTIDRMRVIREELIELRQRLKEERKAQRLSRAR